MKNKAFIWLTAKTSGYILLPLVLLILPADYFDQGQSLCLSKLLAGIECYGCGMTRAIMHLIHLEFQAAAGFNKLCFIVFPVLSLLWAQWFWQDYKRLQQLRRQSLPPQEGKAQV
ncbi:MAG TPA: DUF2752 domain-containing protein [Flavisolibacter sp.]